MTFNCNVCQHTSVIRRNGQLQCARCGHPVVYYSASEDINYERMLHRAKAYLTAGEYELAQTEYRKLSQLRPEDFLPYLGLAASISHAFSNQNFYEQTIAILDKARRLMPRGLSLPKPAKDYIDRHRNNLELSVREKEEAIQFNNMIAIVSLMISILTMLISGFLSVIAFLISLYFFYKNLKSDGKINELRRAKKTRDDFYHSTNNQP